MRPEACSACRSQRPALRPEHQQRHRPDLRHSGGRRCSGQHNGTPGSYTITVSLTGGGATDSQTFLWTVNALNILTNPGVQTNAEGDTVSLQLQVTNNAGAALS